jgi:hypothetical protein
VDELDRHDRVGPLRDGAARGDRHRLVGGQRARGGAARRNPATTDSITGAPSVSAERSA